MKKSQASVEFLTTYGWAFIVLMVVIIALVHFNLVSVDVFSRQYCSISPQMECTDFGVFEKNDGGDEDVLAFTVRNNFDKNISINKTTGVTTSLVECKYNMSGFVGPLPLPALERGRSATIYCTSDGDDVKKGNTVSMVFTVYFSQIVNGALMPEHNITGKVTAKAECEWDFTNGQPGGGGC